MLYKHYKGGLYVVLVETAFLESNCNMVVVYKSAETGKVWVRGYEEFHGFVKETTDKGEFVASHKRFTKI